jgi:hypothetical protein
MEGARRPHRIRFEHLIPDLIPDLVGTFSISALV